MRVKQFESGLESISRWQIDDEQHLPKLSRLAPKFLPRTQALDEILARPTLEERLPNLLEPELSDPDLLEPSVMTEARNGARDAFRSAASQTEGARREALREAAAILDQEVTFDEEIRQALAELLKG